MNLERDTRDTRDGRERERRQRERERERERETHTIYQTAHRLIDELTHAWGDS